MKNQLLSFIIGAVLGGTGFAWGRGSFREAMGFDSNGFSRDDGREEHARVRYLFHSMATEDDPSKESGFVPTPDPRERHAGQAVSSIFAPEYRFGYPAWALPESRRSAYGRGGIFRGNSGYNPGMGLGHGSLHFAAGSGWYTPLQFSAWALGGKSTSWRTYGGNDFSGFFYFNDWYGNFGTEYWNPWPFYSTADFLPYGSTALEAPGVNGPDMVRFWSLYW